MAGSKQRREQGGAENSQTPRDNSFTRLPSCTPEDHEHTHIENGRIGKAHKGHR